jgi:hypothetical protein
MIKGGDMPRIANDGICEPIARHCIKRHISVFGIDDACEPIAIEDIYTTICIKYALRKLTPMILIATAPIILDKYVINIRKAKLSLSTGI